MTPLISASITDIFISMMSQLFDFFLLQLQLKDLFPLLAISVTINLNPPGAAECHYVIDCLVLVSLLVLYACYE